MRIIGIDVGRGSAVLCCLDRFPTNIQQHYKKLRQEKRFHQVKCNQAGVEKLLFLEPNGIVLEPTGFWYSQFWVAVAQKYAIAIYWIGHTDLDKQRGSYGFPNKRDEEDALCLAASYFDDRFIDSNGNKRFLKYYYGEDTIISRVRERFLEKEQLQKIRTGLIAQLRQRLSYEFPEIASHRLDISFLKGYTPLVSWLAFGQKNARYDNKYRDSVVNKLDIKISDYTRNHANAIFDVEQRITKNQDALKEMLLVEQFQPYLRVFERFGFGLNNKILLLYYCYPFDKFLVDGKRWVEREKDVNGRLQKRDRSLRKFQAFLGMSYSYRQSGSKNSRTFHGSSLVRSHLYVWAVCMIAPRNQKIKSEIGRQLWERYDELRQTVKGKDAIIRILFKATRMLFYELSKEING